MNKNIFLIIIIVLTILLIFITLLVTPTNCINLDNSINTKCINNKSFNLKNIEYATMYHNDYLFFEDNKILIASTKDNTVYKTFIFDYKPIKYEVITINNVLYDVITLEDKSMHYISKDKVYKYDYDYISKNIFNTNILDNKDKLPNYAKGIKIHDSLSLNEFYIYGTHFNLNSTIYTNFNNIESAKLILKSTYNTYEYEVNYTYDDMLFSLTTGDILNAGINLEVLKEGNYILYLELNADNKVYNYGFTNSNNSNDITYYTLSNSNRKIEISTKYNKQGYLLFEVSKNKDNIEVCDIVLDPGHGGIDSGATNGEYNEADFTLSYAKKVKTNLQNYGYKVCLTRDSELLPNASNPYKNGRINKPYEVHAKYFFSIHFNASIDKSTNGIEIYTTRNVNYNLAREIANQVEKDTKLEFSSNDNYMKQEDGVYYRAFSKYETENLKNSLENKGKEMYTNFVNIPYYFVLRETGGFMTGSYVDGRDNEDYVNKYRDSNYAAESYLLELAYISNENDLNIMLEDIDNITNSIAKGINNGINKINGR